MTWARDTFPALAEHEAHYVSHFRESCEEAHVALDWIDAHHDADLIAASLITPLR